jgi:hypothetical protein
MTLCRSGHADYGAGAMEYIASDLENTPSVVPLRAAEG